MAAGATVILVPEREITLGTRQITPPQAWYVQREDQLYVRFQSSAAVTFIVTIRLLIASGEIIPMRFDFTSTGGSGNVTFRRELAEGFLLSAVVAIGFAGTQRGQSYIQVGIFRGALVDDGIAAVLLSGYVTGFMAIGWPGAAIEDSLSGRGFRRSITGTNPAAGAEISETVPTNRVWRLHGISATLVTAAGGSDRRAILLIDDATNVVTRSSSGATHAGGTTFNYSGFHAPTQTSAVTGASEIAWPLPRELLLQPGWRIRTATGNLAAGDDWSAPQLAVEEWQQFN